MNINRQDKFVHDRIYRFGDATVATGALQNIAIAFLRDLDALVTGMESGAIYDTHINTAKFKSWLDCSKRFQYKFILVGTVANAGHTLVPGAGLDVRVINLLNGVIAGTDGIDYKALSDWRDSHPNGNGVWCASYGKEIGGTLRFIQKNYRKGTTDQVNYNLGLLVSCDALTTVNAYCSVVLDETPIVGSKLIPLPGVKR